MCGIVGILARRGEPNPSWVIGEAKELAALLTQVIEAIDGEKDVPSSLLDDINQRFHSLRTFETIFQAGCNDEIIEELNGLENKLASILQKIDTVFADDLPFSRQEHLNEMRILFLDAQWQISEDFKGAVKDIGSLNGGSWQAKDHERIHHLWRLDCCLRNVGRIEVRGRDSAGVSVMVTFPNREKYDSFIEQWRTEGQLEKLEERKQQADFAAYSVIGGGYPGLIFAYKIAKEIGRMGENVAKLRADISNDELLQTLLDTEGMEFNVLAHTRWASNGVISEPNAHPQDCRSEGEEAEAGRVCAVLNGDIDNYQELLRDYRDRTGQNVSSAITTDAKIIPLLIGEKYRQGEDFLQAFREAVSTFEGSFAIAAHHLDEPDKIYLALKGSGQSLYVGLRNDAIVVASELYGVVEATSKFVKMDGEWVASGGDAGQIVVLSQSVLNSEQSPYEGFSFDGTTLPEGVLTVKEAEITTRDICLGDWSHYFLKEVNESVSSVEKTLRGRFSLPAKEEGEPRLLLDETVVPPIVVDDLKSGKIRRLFCIGQGTAGIAAAGVSVALEKYLEGLGLDIQAIRASELSGHHMSERMDDCLIVAVSQSGTTADTNRTVDLVRSRGARCISIVNRRNSDLVYKSDGVLYTSDGRDVEMSVASTKAFYSQVTAGFLLALHLADKTGVIGGVALRRALEALKRLPRALETVMESREAVANCAKVHSLDKMHWACVGSGSNYVAAMEIRIKLSELCYKSIACDFLEDKKHIDLSSEPLILMCATGLDSVMLTDAVKEAAIFKAHRSVPIVFASEGADLFEAYAADVIRCPVVGEGLDFIPQVMAGHLFGFYAAEAIDERALPLRTLRTKIVEALATGTTPNLDETGTIERDLLMNGAVSASLDSGTASRLLLALRYARGKLSLDDFAYDFAEQATRENVLQNAINVLTEAINQLTRPIDAIKHQAKTVTVGITREEIRLDGPLATVFKDLEVPESLVSRSSMELLRALAPLVETVEGASHYLVEGLTQTGLPQKSATCQRVSSWGAAKDWVSRTSTTPSLKGTKWLCVKERSPYIGVGRKDGRTIAIVPLAPPSTGEKTTAGLMLFHLNFTGSPEAGLLAEALKRYEGQYDRLIAAATELDLEWNDELLTKVPVVELFDESLDKVVEAIKSGNGH